MNNVTDKDDFDAAIAEAEAALPPLRVFEVRSFDPVSSEFVATAYRAHAVVEKESGSIWLIEVQVDRLTGRPVERIVKGIREWDDVREIYSAPTSLLITH